MSATLLTLPYELREQIISFVLHQQACIRLQAPWENRAVFTPPLTQVCELLREEAIRTFYYVNRFTWTIDPEARESTDPDDYSLSTPYTSDKPCRPTGPQVSMLPWQSPTLFGQLRHLRLNMYLPDPYSASLWEDTLATQLANLIKTIDNGRKLKDLSVLIATWHHFRDLRAWQTKVFGIFKKMEIRGHVHIRTRSLDGKLSCAIRNLDLASKMRNEQGLRARSLRGEACGAYGGDLDWEWEGGVVV